MNDGPHYTDKEKIERLVARHEADKKERAAQSAQIARLREVLEPFRVEAEMWTSATPDDFTPMITDPRDNKRERAAFTVGDLRRAARALADTGK